MRAPWRTGFNRHKDFVVRKKIVLDGELLVAGSPLPKERVTTRRLRQLFDCRIIVFADDPAAPPPTGKTAEPTEAPSTEPDPGDVQEEISVPPEEVSIPQDWRKLNAAAKVDLARQIAPDANAPTGAAAASIIAEELKRRAGTS